MRVRLAVGINARRVGDVGSRGTVAVLHVVLVCNSPPPVFSDLPREAAPEREAGGEGNPAPLPGAAALST